MLPHRVRISDRVFFQELVNETVILDMAEGQYWGLDDVGSRMWQLLTEHGDDLPKAVEALKAFYNVDEHVLTNDLTELIERLRAAGLVTVEPSA